MTAKNARRNRKAPSIREREGEALVTLTDSVSGFRRDYRLGAYGSAKSRAAYHMLIADWEARERRLPPPLRAPTRRTYNPVRLEGDRGPTVTQLIADYYTWARGYYSEPAAWCIRSALRVLRAAYGTTAAKDFGPNALRAVRDLMIKGDLQGEKPRSAWCRKTVNTRIGHIVRMFKWAVSRELIEPDVHLALAALPPLKRGKTKAVDHAPIKPPDPALIEAAKPFMSEQVRALVDLQLLTGARPGELLGLRTCDIDTDTDTGVWEPYLRPHARGDPGRVREHHSRHPTGGALPWTSGEGLRRSSGSRPNIRPVGVAPSAARAYPALRCSTAWPSATNRLTAPSTAPSASGRCGSPSRSIRRGGPAHLCRVALTAEKGSAAGDAPCCETTRDTRIGGSLATSVQAHGRIGS